jgi:hypothetical protein
MSRRRSTPTPDAANISRIVKLYLHEFAPQAHEELDHYRELDTLRDVVSHAAMATTANGKVHAHQRRVGRQVLSKARTALLSRLNEIEACESFDDLLSLIESATSQIDRFGELAAYDTALRIGAWLKLSPEVVYLHAGTRKGAASLRLGKGVRCVQMSEMPVELRRLSPDQVEDLLCIFKDHLHINRTDSPRRLRSRC